MIKRIIIIVAFILFLSVPANAMEIEAPEVPESGAQLMPDDPQSFGEGLLWILKKGMEAFQPEVINACKLCVQIIAVIILTSVTIHIPGKNEGIIKLVSTVSLAAVLLGTSRTLISLGAETVRTMSEYGKLLLPVMTAALTAQGGVTSASALYVGTAFFNYLLTAVINGLIIPMLYVYLCLCIAGNVLEEGSLTKLKDFVKWLMTWLLKIILYVFTGYLSITGVVSGATDATAVKATKLTISGVVPVVGNILSDASEMVLVSAGILKNAAGIYGVLALISLWLAPFIKIGTQYLILKLTASICDVFGDKKSVCLVHDFSGGMGMLVGMTGTVCLLHLVSTICFMKGIG